MAMSLKPFMDFAITNAERLAAMNEGKISCKFSSRHKST